MNRQKLVNRVDELNARINELNGMRPRYTTDTHTLEMIDREVHLLTGHKDDLEGLIYVYYDRHKKSTVSPAPMPTVGRIVFYVPYPGVTKYPVVPAIVVFVHEDNTIDIKSFGAYSADFIQQDINYDETKEPGTWHWPPRS